MGLVVRSGWGDQIKYVSTNQFTFRVTYLAGFVFFFFLLHIDPFGILLSPHVVNVVGMCYLTLLNLFPVFVLPVFSTKA